MSTGGGAGPILPPNWQWRGVSFGLNPLPYAGWTLLGFSLAVCLGAAIRRTVPAMAATLACYLTVLYLVTITRNRGYLPPLRRAAPQPVFSSHGGYGFFWPQPRGEPGTDQISTTLGWPDGRPLSPAQRDHNAAWFHLHHIQVWVTYQPGSRFGLFELIESGWLAALSALLLAVTVLLIRRRPA